MKRKHGHWASGWPAAVPPASPSAFETRVRELKLTAPAFVESRELQRWCKENRNKSYIPEWLLEAWGMSVNADLP
jgi:hypothetical protein